MLRARKKDVRIKPNRKLDKRSSRGMLYENEELRLRTIEINAEVRLQKQNPTFFLTHWQPATSGRSISIHPNPQQPIKKNKQNNLQPALGPFLTHLNPFSINLNPEC